VLAIRLLPHGAPTPLAEDTEAVRA
jgi:hypothetical protein